MAYGEKIQYISAIEVILKEQEKKKRDLYLDELIDISARNGRNRETDILEKFKYNKDGMRDFAVKNGNGYVFRQMLATAYEEGLQKKKKQNMLIRTFGDYVIADDVIILYTGKESRVEIPANFENVAIRKVGAGLLYANEAVRYVIVSDGIREIGKMAFAKCSHLRKVTLAPSVDKIHPDTFKGSDTLWSLEMYKEISQEIHDEITESGIELTDRRYIIDPMIFGSRFVRQIRKYMPGPMKGGFRVYKDMGCLFEIAPRAVDPKKKPVPLLFQDYADRHHTGAHDFRTENAAFTFKIMADDIEQSFEHDEEADDFGLSNRDEYDKAGLVFVNGFDRSYGILKACLELKGGTFFFQRGVQVKLGQGIYYLYFREVFSTDDNRPYVRRLGTNRIFARYGPLSDGDDRSMDIVKRFSLISELL